MSNDQLPDRDPTKTNAEQGLYGKLYIWRTDGTSAPGCKHHGCDYFVLDVTHDKHAAAALAAYAEAAGATHPQLAADMRARWKLPVRPVGDSTNDKQHEHLSKLADAFFEQLIMLEWEYGAPGLDPKRPFGNSDVERDILVLLDIDPEGEDGDAECFSDRQREYAADLFKVQLIPFLQKAWATPPDAGLAVRALEELHQLGYVVRDGLLYPPERTQPAGDAALPPLPKPLAVGVWGYAEPTTFTADQMKEYAMADTAALRSELAERDARIAGMRVEWAAEVAALQAEGAKSERRATEFGDALHRHILAMRAAVVAWHSVGPRSGIEWIANTLAGPGHLPSHADIALGAQALFDKEVAEHEAFRAAHPAPAAPAPRDTDAMMAELMQRVDVTQCATAEHRMTSPAVCTECEAALAARLPVRPWEFDPGQNQERCTCAGADSSCEVCIATRQLFDEWVTEQRLLDASAWIAYQRAWPEAMTGRHLHARGWQRNSAGAAAQALRDAVQLPDMLAASEHAEPSGEEP